MKNSIEWYKIQSGEIRISYKTLIDNQFVIAKLDHIFCIFIINWILLYILMKCFIYSVNVLFALDLLVYNSFHSDELIKKKLIELNVNFWLFLDLKNRTFHHRPRLQTSFITKLSIRYSFYCRDIYFYKVKMRQFNGADFYRNRPPPLLYFYWSTCKIMMKKWQ